MSDKPKTKEFFLDENFLTNAQARSIRIQSEYLGPKVRLADKNVTDTIVFFGSARILSPEEAARNLKSLLNNASAQKKIKCQQDVKNSQYFSAAVQLAKKLTLWSKKLKSKDHRYIITSGGGPGIMQAANKGASDAKGLSIGMNISLPFEPSSNPYITTDLDIQFHYFFMRKFWMAYLAKALVAFPGGFGTLDELMEILTLIQTEKISKQIPIVLFGEDFWTNVINWDYLVKAGTISKKDLKLFIITDSVETAFDHITSEIIKRDFKGPNF